MPWESKTANSATVELPRFRTILCRKSPEPRSMASISLSSDIRNSSLQHSESRLAILSRMETEQTIAEIEWLERILAVPDMRPLSPSDISAANRRHDEMLAHSPWFRIWQRYGVCCRHESPIIQLPE